MPDFHIEAIRELIRMNNGRFVACRNEDVCIDNVTLFI
jgi:hypothetical protein